MCSICDPRHIKMIVDLVSGVLQ